jgi:aminoglycoside/choline kinase family phosphotransferase
MPPNAPYLPPTWADSQRQALFQTWFDRIQPLHQLVTNTVRLASADASFRRYLRVDSPSGSLVIMDAPPEKEDCKPFARVAQLMEQAGLKAPKVLEWEETHGFMLLTDLGAKTMMQVIDPAAPPPLPLYLEAVDALVQWQKSSVEGALPPYDQALLKRELDLFPEWYIGKHRKFELDDAQRKTLDSAFAQIIQRNLAWPSVFVHRDFMPRNLMIGAGGIARVHDEKLGVLDFQDAVYGPVTYDIASLMRDAFLSWEEDFYLDVTIRYWEKARKAGLPVGDDFGEFYKGVEWMGLQRHLKIAGIFARLTLRDGKPQYLADTPRFIGYILSTCARYGELKPLLRLVERIEGFEAPTGFSFGRI